MLSTDVLAIHLLTTRVHLLCRHYFPSPGSNLALVMTVSYRSLVHLYRLFLSLADVVPLLFI